LTDEALRETGMPLVGHVVRHAPNEELIIDRVLDIDEDRFIADHLFVYAEGVKPAHECLPIMAMSFIVEMVGEVAAGLCPGLGLIGYEDIRAFRWIGLRDDRRADMRINTRVAAVDAATGVTRVETFVEFEGKKSFSATVLFSAEYRCDLPWHIDDPPGDQSWPWTQPEVYGTRRMFHGPAFQCVSGLTCFGNPVAEAELRVLPKDQLFASNAQPNLLTEPCLVDGLAQIIGLWAQAYGWFVLPTGIEKLEVYCPTPPVGTRVKVRMELMEFDMDLKQLACRFEVEDGDGRIWMRAEGWRDWVFKWSERFVEFLRVPSRQALGEPIDLPGLPENAVCMWLDMSDVWHTDLDWASRVILHADELPVFRNEEQLNAKRRLLWSRALVKDVARVWSAAGDAAMAHPASLPVDHNEAGQPSIRTIDAGAKPPHVSLAHNERTAVAIASSSATGVDIEPAGRDLSEILPQIATDAEIAIVNEIAPDVEDAHTRMWCAKEAVSKCVGTGLQGRPKDFIVVHATSDGTFEIEHVPTGECFGVATTRFKDWIVGYTFAEWGTRSSGKPRGASA